jgi:predicted HAD superfamily Cof-like phosphohydrolase
MTDVFRLTADFARTIMGVEAPPAPRRLSEARKTWASRAFREEVKEFEDAETIEDEVDAVIDLIYFAAGRLHEMGVDGAAHFMEVHLPNMRKVRGTLQKRSHGLGVEGYDAVKPEGWTGPDHLRLIRERYATAAQRPGAIALPDRSGKPLKVLLLGHARHGKDTVAELLRDRHGFSFQSSSMFAAERIVMPHFALTGAPYGDVASCYEDRVNHRATWYDLICAYNREDPARLARELFAESDVYVGLRALDEFKAVERAGLFDLCIWVDRSDHVGPEDASSCTVTPSCADVVLDNNGTPEQTASNLASILHGFRR